MGDRESFLRRIARGDEVWHELPRYGIIVTEHASGICISESPAHPVSITATDIATGLRRHANDPAQLQRWAQLLHAGASLFELDLDDHPDGDALLDMLWRLSFRESLSPVAIAALTTKVLEQDTEGA